MNEPMEIPPVRTPAEEPAEADLIDPLPGEAVSSLVIFHGVLFLTCLSVIVLSMVMTVRGEESVVLPVINRPLPGICTFKRVTGIPCPGCGLTRCFISVGHGDLARAAHFSPVGIAFYLVVASQIPYRFVQIRRVLQRKPEISLGWWGGSAVGVIAFGLIGQWIIRTLLRI